MCVCVYPYWSLRRALLVECAPSLPAVDRVLDLSAELARRWPLLVKCLNVLQRPVGGGQVIGTCTHTLSDFSDMISTQMSVCEYFRRGLAPSPSVSDGSISSIMYSTSSCRAHRLDRARTYIITGRKSSAPWDRPAGTKGNLNLHFILTVSRGLLCSPQLVRTDAPQSHVCYSTPRSPGSVLKQSDWGSITAGYITIRWPPDIY